MVDFKDKITNDGSPDVRGILESLTVARADGTTAATNIAVSGIKTTAKILSVLEVSSAGAGEVNDRTSEASVTSDGNIQLDTTDTTGDDLIIIYFNLD